MRLKEYKQNDKKNIVETCVKYYIISGFLDILIEFKNFGNDSPSFSQVWQRFKETYHNYDIDWGVGLNVPTRIAIYDMVWMNLITLDKTSEEILEARGNGDFHLTLTESGLTAYRDQRFHIISANLYTAKETSALSRIALRVSITAILVSIVVGVMSLICTQDVKVVEVSSKVKSEISGKIDSFLIREDIPRTVNHQGAIKIFIDKKEQKISVDSLKRPLRNVK